MFRGDPVVLSRDCEAVMVPAGHRVIIPEGTEVTITQSLGGSFTVYAGGNLARIDGKDGDALGEKPLEQVDIEHNASRDDVEEAITAQLKTVFDPEIPINVVDLGLIYECATVELGPQQYRVEAKLTLTAPGCGMGDILIDDAKTKLELIPQVTETNIELVFDPPWTQDMMSEEAKLQTGMFY